MSKQLLGWGWNSNELFIKKAFIEAIYNKIYTNNIIKKNKKNLTNCIFWNLSKIFHIANIMV